MGIPGADRPGFQDPLYPCRARGGGSHWASVTPSVQWEQSSYFIQLLLKTKQIFVLGLERLGLLVPEAT